MTTSTSTSAELQAYTEIEAAALPLIEHYQTDLTKHDRNAIYANDGAAFLHATRSHGTLIFSFRPHDSPAYPDAWQQVPYLFGTADRRHILTQDGHVIRSNDRSGDTWHHWTGKTLQRITHAEAVKKWNEHEARILERWNQDELRGVIGYNPQPTAHA